MLTIEQANKRIDQLDAELDKIKQDIAAHRKTGNKTMLRAALIGEIHLKAERLDLLQINKVL